MPPRTLLSHSTLGAAFHENFTPILTITQLVTVRSNHSESGNHDRVPIDKATHSSPLKADCAASSPRVKFEWIDKISFGNLFRWFPSRIVWDATGSKNWWESSWKVQRPTLRTSCLQSQLWQFGKIIRNLFGLNLINSPGNRLQIVIYCSNTANTEN